jgi:hypothetical protein
MSMFARTIRVIAYLLLIALVWLGATLASTYVMTDLTGSTGRYFKYALGEWMEQWFYIWGIVYLLVIVSSPFVWRKRAVFEPLLCKVTRWVQVTTALMQRLQGRLILIWRSIVDNAYAKKIFAVSSYATVMSCYIAGGIISSLGLVAIGLMFMWPPLCLTDYIAEHTQFVARMAGVDPLLWKCMFYLIALSAVSLPLRIVVRVWWRLIGSRIVDESVFTNHAPEQKREEIENVLMQLCAAAKRSAEAEG